jgi:hypothetical protein
MFHLIEDGVRGSLRGERFLETIHAEAFANIGGLFARLLFVFFTFIPFFALMETRRVLGVDRFRELFLGTAHRRNGSSGTSHTSEPMIEEHR